ncbi:Jag N-terminal domain-containing protein [Helicobacter baculiformis]|uniref:Jag N-terminal domain-containing protein n=1 Tax=Helicobacter baculiformis TaxID=427351 RepID=A0ABV7ZFK0_9HELI|nr:Jag N-terminal domain-containing protein [Helicobacter baculiformis]
MRTIVASSLEEALFKAATELGCSVSDLQYNVIQVPSRGFLGFGKKQAIIEVCCKEKPKSAPPSPLPSKADTVPHAKIMEIQQEICALLAHIPYQIDSIQVELYNPQTLLIEIKGEDCALLIGEKGYRYNALSYLLFSWIHPKYGYNIRLEVANFLKEQEEMIEHYLQSVIMMVHEVGKAKTKPLDGLLLHIALKRLRETFPNKHVTCQSKANNQRYIVVNDFHKP